MNTESFYLSIESFQKNCCLKVERESCCTIIQPVLSSLAKPASRFFENVFQENNDLGKKDKDYDFEESTLMSGIGNKIFNPIFPINIE